MKKDITIGKRGYLIAIRIIIPGAYFKTFRPFFLNMAVGMKNDINVSSVLTI